MHARSAQNALHKHILHGIGIVIIVPILCLFTSAMHNMTINCKLAEASAAQTQLTIVVSVEDIQAAVPPII